MSGKSRRNSILKTRGEGESCEINAQDWENGGTSTSRNLTGLLKRRVSFSQTNQVKEFDRSKNSSSDNSANASNIGVSMEKRCDNLDTSVLNDSILDGMEKENTERSKLNETCYDGEGDMEMTSLGERETETETALRRSPRRKSVCSTNKTVIGGDMDVSMVYDPATGTSASDQSENTERVKMQSNQRKSVNSSNKTINGGDMEMSTMQGPLSADITRCEDNMEMKMCQSNKPTSMSSTNKTMVGGDMDMSAYDSEQCEGDSIFVQKILPITPHKSARSKAGLANQTVCTPGNMEMTMHHEDRRQSVSLKNKTIIGGQMDISPMREESGEKTVNNETLFEPENMEMTILNQNSHRRKSVALNNQTIAGGDMEMSPLRVEKSRSRREMDLASYASPASKSVQTINKTITWADMNMSVVSCESPSAKQEMSARRSSQRKSIAARNTTLADGDKKTSLEEHCERATTNQTALEDGEMDMSILPSTFRKSVSTSSKNKTIIGGCMDMTSADDTAQNRVATYEIPLVGCSKVHAERQSPPLPERDHTGTIMIFGKVDTSKLEDLQRALGSTRIIGKKRRYDQQRPVGTFAATKTPKRAIQDSRKKVRTEAAKEDLPPEIAAIPPSRKETREIAINTSLGGWKGVDASIMTTPTITQAAGVVPVEPKTPRTRSMARTKASSGMSPIATDLMRKSVGKQKSEPELSILAQETDSGSGKGSTSSDCNSPDCKVKMVAETPYYLTPRDRSPKSPSDKHENAVTNYSIPMENTKAGVTETVLPMSIQTLSAIKSVDFSQAITEKVEITSVNKAESDEQSRAMMEPKSPRTRSMLRTKVSSGMSPMATSLMKRSLNKEKPPKEKSFRGLHSETGISSGNGSTDCESSPDSKVTMVAETPIPVAKPKAPLPIVKSSSSTKSLSPSSLSPAKENTAVSKLVSPVNETNHPKPASSPKPLSKPSPLKVEAERLEKNRNEAKVSSRPEILRQNPLCALSPAALKLQRKLFDSSSAFAQLPPEEQTTYETLLSKSNYLSDLLPYFAQNTTDVEILEIFRPQEIRRYVGENYINRVQRAKASWIARQTNHPTIFAVPVVGELFKRL